MNSRGKKTGLKREREREKTSRIQSTISKLFRWLNFARRFDASRPRPPRSRDNSLYVLLVFEERNGKIRVNVAGLKKKTREKKQETCRPIRGRAVESNMFRISYLAVCSLLLPVPRKRNKRPRESGLGGGGGGVVEQ